MNTDTILKIQGDSAFLTLEVQHREHSEDTECWSANWVTTRFQARNRGFQADFIESLHLSDLVSLRDDLAKIYAALEGRIEWKAMDGFLDLTAEMDKFGHINWIFDLNYPVGMGARLLLETQNDQTYLPILLAQIDAILEVFPVRESLQNRK